MQVLIDSPVVKEPIIPKTNHVAINVATTTRKTFVFFIRISNFKVMYEFRATAGGNPMSEMFRGVHSMVVNELDFFFKKFFIFFFYNFI